MKQFVMQSVHAEEVVVQMMKMYGDFGKFTNNGGNVFYESNIGKKIQGELWAEINVYASGYHAAIDELAALRAERDELREALETIADPKNWREQNGEIVWNDCEGNEFIPEHAQEIARAVLAKHEAAK